VKILVNRKSDIMRKMWTSKEEIDFEIARDYASKLVLIGSARKQEYLKVFLKKKN